MKQGRISESVLKRSVLKYIRTQRKEMIKGAGSDCAFFRCGETQQGIGMLAVSTQTITLPIKRAGAFAVYAAVNNLAAEGAEAFAITLAITLPEEALEEQLQELMMQIEDTCAALDLQIAGGHTEVTSAVNAPIVSVTAFGKRMEKSGMPNTSEAASQAAKEYQNLRKAEERCNPADLDIIMTKWIGLEGTVLLAQEKKEALLSRYPLSLITAAQGFEKYLPILPEAATALKSDAYTMHDVRNGGVFGGLWELSKRMGVGLSVDLKKIPIKQETIEICEYFDLNPYELMSGGSLLIAVADGRKTVNALAAEGIFAEVIGRTTDNRKKVILNGDEVRFLEPAKQDELLKVWS